MILICDVESCDLQVKSKRLCQAHYHRLCRYGDPLGKPKLKPKFVPGVCEVVDCNRIKTYRSFCQAHYRRIQIHGDVLASVPIMDGTQPITRYRKITAHGHPLADSEGRVLQHRAVLYEAIGPGWHLCNWCDDPITWDVHHPGDYALTVDHLNHRRSDNRLENLVPACSPCNSVRWEWKEMVKV